MDSSLMCNQRLFHFAFDTALRNINEGEVVD